VSDASVDELHEFAHRLGVPFVAHQGDHYDVPAPLRAAAIAAGAEPVDARVLVRRLRAAGLRDRRAHVPWRWLARDAPYADPAQVELLLDRAVVGGADLPIPVGAAVADRLHAAASELGHRARTRPAVSVGWRPGQLLAGLRVDRVVGLDGPVLERTPAWSVHRSAGSRGTFVEVVTGAGVTPRPVRRTGAMWGA